MNVPRRPFVALSLAHLALSAGISCGGAGPPTRPVRLVAREVEIDRGLAEARRRALDPTPQNLADARRTLQSLLSQHPWSNLAPVARLLLVRVLIAQDALESARVELSRVDTRIDPDLPRQHDIAHSLIDARVAARSRNTDDHRAQLTEALTLARPLDQTRPDPEETVALACVLAECAAIEADPNAAVQSIARSLAAVERAERSGTRWVRTGLRCEAPEARERLLADIAARAADLTSLANAIDASESGSPLRRPLAERLLAVARESGRVSSYTRFFADLADDRAVQDAPSVRASAAVIGLMIPLSGPRAAVGTSILRGAQIALEHTTNIRIVLEDEGTNPAQSAAAFDRLHAQGARAVIGPSRDDLAPGAAIRAESFSIPVFLLAVPPGIQVTGAMIQPVAPPTEARAAALARALGTMNQRLRALVIASSTSEPLSGACEEALLQAGVPVSSAPFDAFVVPHRAGFTPVFAGDYGREPRLAIAHAVESLRGRAVLDARAAVVDQLTSTPSPSEDARTTGVWVGVRGSADLPPLVARWCERYEESPDETALLAHDAAILAATALRRTEGLPRPALHPQRELATSTIVRGAPWSAAMPAAAARCPRPNTPHPTPDSP
jgi:hypothetical protein